MVGDSRPSLSISHILSLSSTESTSTLAPASAPGASTSVPAEGRKALLSLHDDPDVTIEEKEDGTLCMTILFPPDPPPNVASKRKAEQEEATSSGSSKVSRPDPTVIEIRLCDSDDDEVDEDESMSEQQQQHQQIASHAIKQEAIEAEEQEEPGSGTRNSGQDQSPDREAVSKASASAEEIPINSTYDEEMTQQEVNTMIQRCRVLMDFFAAGQMPHGKAFTLTEVEKIQNNIRAGTFFSFAELNRLFRQVLLIPDVTSHFTVMVETIATVFYSEEEIRTDFLPQYMMRQPTRSKSHLGKPLRHFRSFQRCFMLVMGFQDPVSFDKTGLMRRVTKDLCRARKEGYRCTKMMNNNRSATFKTSSASAAASVATTSTASPSSSSSSSRTVTFGPTSFRT